MAFTGVLSPAPCGRGATRPPTHGIAHILASGCSQGRLRAVRIKTEENDVMADKADMTDKAGRADSLLLRMGVIGIVILALCCFTPVLVVLLGIVGLSALTGWLDVVLLPALAVFVGLTVYAVWRRRRRMKTT